MDPQVHAANAVLRAWRLVPLDHRMGPCAVRVPLNLWPWQLAPVQLCACLAAPTQGIKLLVQCLQGLTHPAEKRMDLRQVVSLAW